MKKEESRFEDANLFEGMTSQRAVIHAMENGISDRKILRVIVDQDKRKSRAKELAWLGYKAKEFGFEIVYESEEYINSVAVGNSHGGIIFECTARTIPSLEQTESIDGGFWVMIEGIEDPYNFGYALRSLYSCGVDGVIMSPRNWMSAAGVVCRASAGASEHCPLYLAEDSAQVVSVMAELGVPIVSCDMPNSVSVYDADLTLPLFLAVGGEKRGLSREILQASRTVVRLDYGREFPAALSAASAAAIASFEVMRQNRK